MFRLIVCHAWARLCRVQVDRAVQIVALLLEPHAARVRLIQPLAFMCSPREHAK
eukprot:CAMPEP_0119174850 /NCGR_PEP_ID=MMETSP1315-20130426/39943_1 /TAXON_ID=676789 /ORGANISM="Prasinoderma singularis, Strain RCC927" /LENGTH=53 /DNA_ID=CAMNT_0007168887 /DNA_START=133 /DNA_END=291 /DNA_ORIENTATION=+